MPPATRRFNGQAIANLRGDLLFVSEPVTGHNHDMTALAETETADIIAAAYSGIGDKGYQGSDFITPFKKPQRGQGFVKVCVTVRDRQGQRKTAR